MRKVPRGRSKRPNDQTTTRPTAETPTTTVASVAVVTLIATRSVLLLLTPQLSIIFSVIVIVRPAVCLSALILPIFLAKHTQLREHRACRHEWRETESFVSAKCVHCIHGIHASRLARQIYVHRQYLQMFLALSIVPLWAQRPRGVPDLG